MLCDAHVHIGYYPKVGEEALRYYSPRRICGVLRRCGVEDFAVSSTCAQISSIRIDDIIRETREVKRIAGRKAHVLFWLSGHLYDEDRNLSWFDTGLFEGIKIHEGETPWMGERFDDLCRVMEFAEERNMPVQIHSGPSGLSQPSHLKRLAMTFPRIRFDFAHCRPMAEMAKVVCECENVWTDTAYMSTEEMADLPNYDWQNHLMFGSDIPVWQARDRVSLTCAFRSMQVSFRNAISECASYEAFKSWIGITPPISIHANNRGHYNRGVIRNGIR